MVGLIVGGLFYFLVLRSSVSQQWQCFTCSLSCHATIKDFVCPGIYNLVFRDDFNLTGLRALVPNYDYALDLILNDDSDEYLFPEQQVIVNILSAV